MRRNKRSPAKRRRKPVQQRARVTVDAMLDAAVKLLKCGGTARITTNRIAETAGVSIGSVYQYFPNKHALYAALHDRHIAQVDAIVRQKIAECAEAPLEDLIEALVDGMVQTHAADPELSELLNAEVPHRAGGTVEFSARFHAPFRDALARHAKSFGRKIDPDTRAFLVTNMVETLGHAAAIRRPRGLSLAKAKAEASRVILAYLMSA